MELLDFKVQALSLDKKRGMHPSRNRRGQRARVNNFLFPSFLFLTHGQLCDLGDITNCPCAPASSGVNTVPWCATHPASQSYCESNGKNQGSPEKHLECQRKIRCSNAKPQHTTALTESSATLSFVSYVLECSPISLPRLQALGSINSIFLCSYNAVTFCMALDTEKECATQLLRNRTPTREKDLSRK